MARLTALPWTTGPGAVQVPILENPRVSAAWSGWSAGPGGFLNRRYGILGFVKSFSRTERFTRTTWTTWTNIEDIRVFAVRVVRVKALLVQVESPRKAIAGLSNQTPNCEIEAPPPELFPHSFAGPPSFSSEVRAAP
jgi:hypothetical protein